MLWTLLGAVGSFVLWFAWELWSWSRPSFTGWIAGRIASFVFGNSTGPRAKPEPIPEPRPYPHRPI